MSPSPAPSPRLTPRPSYLPSASPTPPTPTPTSTPVSLQDQQFVIIGGGTGCNAILGAFKDARRAVHIVPVSDDGGSSSELQRVLGGPALGDIRSRLIRLIPEAPEKSPLAAIKRLLEYRLAADKPSSQVKAEWLTIVEGKHKLWKGIPNDRKETIRAFLVHFSAAVLRKASKGFNYQRASVGNILLCGAALFLGSVPSAVYLFASLCEIRLEQVAVVPAINTSLSAVIAAELESGDVVVGQSEISHPAPKEAGGAAGEEEEAAAGAERPTTPGLRPPTPGGVGGSPGRSSRAPTPGFEAPVLGDEDGESGSEGSDEDEDAADARRNRNVVFSKGEVPPLESRIRRIMYLSPFGHETFPKANPLFLNALHSASVLVYAPGSLYTSIVPCLALRAVGRAIARSPSLAAKVLFLNATHDREAAGYSARDFVEAVRAACGGRYEEGGAGEGEGEGDERVEAREVVTHVVYLEGAEVECEVGELEAMGIACVACEAAGVGAAAGQFDEESARRALGVILGVRA